MSKEFEIIEEIVSEFEMLETETHSLIHFVNELDRIWKEIESSGKDKIIFDNFVLFSDEINSKAPNLWDDVVALTAWRKAPIEVHNENIQTIYNKVDFKNFKYLALYTSPEVLKNNIDFGEMLVDVIKEKYNKGENIDFTEEIGIFDDLDDDFVLGSELESDFFGDIDLDIQDAIDIEEPEKDNEYEGDVINPELLEIHTGNTNEIDNLIAYFKDASEEEQNKYLDMIFKSKSIEKEYGILSEISVLLLQSKTLKPSVQQKCIDKADMIFTNHSLLTFDDIDEDVFVNYFEDEIKNNNLALYDNSLISHMYYAAKTNKLSKFGMLKDKEILEIFEQNKSKELLPDMSKYDKYIDNFEDVDFEEFVSDIKTIKILGEKIPDKCCDYIIKLKMDSKIDLDKHKTLYERALEDKTWHILKEQGLSDENFVYIVDPIDDRVAGTAYPDGTLFLQRECMNELSELNTFPLHVIFHECRHAKQFFDIENNISPRNYTMLKESIIRKKNPDKFYADNYDYFHAEIDAEILGAKESQNYIRELGYSNVSKEQYSKQQQEFISRYKRYDNKKIFKEEVVDVNELFEETLKKDLRTLDKYPVLNLEFNSNGERKNRAELLKEYDRMFCEIKKDKNSPEKDNIVFMSTIMASGYKKDPKTLVAELDSLMDYTPTTSKMEKYLNNIIETGALQLYSSASGLYGIELDENDNYYDKLDNYNSLEEKLMEFAKKHPELNVAKAIREGIELSEEDIESLMDFDSNDDLANLINNYDTEKQEDERKSELSDDELDALTDSILNKDFDELDILMSLYESTTQVELAEGNSFIRDTKIISKSNNLEKDDFEILE